MVVSLPSGRELLAACAGGSSPQHPVALLTARLAVLHRSRYRAEGEELYKIDCARADYVLAVDRWTASNAPLPHGAAYLHTESVGTIIDRIAAYHVEAHAALEQASEPVRHHLWERLAELSLAYTDLSSEIAAGLRKLPVAGCAFGADKRNLLAWTGIEAGRPL